MRAVVVSVGVHAVAVAAIAAWHLNIDDSAVRGPTDVLVPQIELVAIESSAPIEIALVTFPDQIAQPIARGARSSQPAVTARAARGTELAARASGDPAIGSLEPSPEQPGPRWGQMRGLRHDLSIPHGVIDRMMSEPTAAPEDPPTPDERLKRKRDGTYRINDRVTRVAIAKDGGAHFKDKPDFKIGFGNPLRWVTKLSAKKLGKDVGDAIEEWREDPYRQTKAGPTSGLSNLALAVPGGWPAIGDDADRPKSKRKHDDDDDDDDDDAGGGIFGGRLEITDYLHRKYIGDPYASRKLKILDSTRDERARIGASYRSEQLGRATELTMRNLQAAWNATTDAASRRAATFELWDDCAEGEGALGDAGDRARKIVIGWIAAKLPAGSPGAFTADEIARFDARRTSRQHFAPYSQ